MGDTSPCRWALAMSAMEKDARDENGRLVDLPPLAQVLRGKDLLGMLKCPVVQQKHPARSRKDKRRTHELLVSVTVKHTFIELVEERGLTRLGKRSLSDSALLRKNPELMDSDWSVEKSILSCELPHALDDASTAPSMDDSGAESSEESEQSSGCTTPLVFEEVPVVDRRGAMKVCLDEQIPASNSTCSWDSVPYLVAQSPCANECWLSDSFGLYGTYTDLWPQYKEPEITASNWLQAVHSGGAIDSPTTLCCQEVQHEQKGLQQWLQSVVKSEEGCDIDTQRPTVFNGRSMTVMSLGDAHVPNALSSMWDSQNTKYNVYVVKTGSELNTVAPDAAAVADHVEEHRTTVMLRNIPNAMQRSMLVKLINEEGFACEFDFVYLPVDFGTKIGLGYAFVNFTTAAAALRCWDKFEGFKEWSLASDKVCSVTWSMPHQGLLPHIDRYRNSPVMHESIPDEWKPAMYSRGNRLMFPPPTKPIPVPKVRARAGDNARKPADLQDVGATN